MKNQNRRPDSPCTGPAGDDRRARAAEVPVVYGYIRVSTRDQNEARQVDAMRQFGVDRMLIDRQSGKDFDRPAYIGLMKRLRPGDVLVVKSIDRLGRNYSEILEQWRMITRQKGAAIVVLDMPLLDTRSKRDLTGTLIADIVLQLLSYIAETERAFIRQRQREGIKAALARGQRFGPPPKKRRNRRRMRAATPDAPLGSTGDSGGVFSPESVRPLN